VWSEAKGALRAEFSRCHGRFTDVFLVLQQQTRPSLAGSVSTPRQYPTAIMP
jgi:hypothetical protein